MRKLKTLCLCLMACMTSLFSSPLEKRELDSSALEELFAALGVDPARAVEQTQKEWLRKAGEERWHMQEIAPEKRQFVLEWGKKQKLFQAWEPTKMSYDKVFILGATTGRMETRLAFLKKMWKEGVRFQEVVWMTGDRPLDPQVDRLLDVCKTETDAAHYIWERAELDPQLRALPCVFIAVPMKEKEGKKLRPTTEDTVVAWLQTNPKPCTALFISDQPFCGYQFAVIKGSMPKEFGFDLVGAGVEAEKYPNAAAVVLDSLARTLYQQAKNQR